MAGTTTDRTAIALKEKVAKSTLSEGSLSTPQVPDANEKDWKQGVLSDMFAQMRRLDVPTIKFYNDTIWRDAIYKLVVCPFHRHNSPY